MNKLTKIPAILIILFFSCTQQKDKIIGCWIEKDNFKNPIQVEFMDFSYRQEVDNSISENLYHIDKDTFYTAGFQNLNRSKIKFSGDEFSLFDTANDSLLVTFEKNITGNFIDYFNFKKNTKIKLPEINALALDLAPERKNNVIFADYIDNQLQVYFNGDLHNFNDTSFLDIFNSVQPEDYIINNWLYLDKDILVSDVRKIKNELQKAQLYRIAFIVSCKNKLANIKVKMPTYDKPYSQSLKYPIPPPPPPLIWDFKKESFNDNNILCYISDTLNLYNSKNVNLEQLLKSINDKIAANPKTVIHVYFDDKMTCEKYLSSLFSLQTVYYNLRAKIASEKFEGANIDDLDSETQDKIKKIQPMQIRELDNELYLELKKYAL